MLCSFFANLARINEEGAVMVHTKFVFSLSPFSSDQPVSQDCPIIGPTGLMMGRVMEFSLSKYR